MTRYGRSPIERVMDKVVVGDNDCWLFVGARTSGGYGHIRVDGRLISTHRLTFEYFRSEIPTELELDHLCRVRHCVNPWHLEPVTRAENCQRGANGRDIKWVRVDSCKRGHLYTAENTYITPDGHRSCNTCQRDNERRYRQRRKVMA